MVVVVVAAAATAVVVALFIYFYFLFLFIYLFIKHKQNKQSITNTMASDMRVEESRVGRKDTGRKEMLYLTMHSTHFI